MRQSVSTFRVLSIAILALGTVVATTGCFKKGARGDYALAPEVRPLEVPPDLTAPAGATQSATGATGSALASQAARPAPAAAPGQAPAAPANTVTGFNVGMAKEQAFTDVGTALESIDGLTISTRAQLLGSYDVAFEGSNFLVRVVAVEAGAYISAVDPRGQPATAEAPVKLIAALKAQLAR